MNLIRIWIYASKMISGCRKPGGTPFPHPEAVSIAGHPSACETTLFHNLADEKVLRFKTRRECTLTGPASS